MALRAGAAGDPAAAAGGAGGAVPGGRVRLRRGGTVWVRWVAASKVFDEMWARKALAEVEAAESQKRSASGGYNFSSYSVITIERTGQT